MLWFITIINLLNSFCLVEIGKPITKELFESGKAFLTQNQGSLNDDKEKFNIKCIQKKKLQTKFELPNEIPESFVFIIILIKYKNKIPLY